MRYLNEGQRQAIDVDHMGAQMERLDHMRLRSLRDRMLVYLYEEGAGNPLWDADIGDIKKALGITAQEFAQVANLLHHQGMLSNGQLGSIGLSSAGQREAERLKPTVAFQDAPVSGPSHVIVSDNTESVIQIAGSHSQQSASISIDQSKALQLLADVELAIKDSDLPAETKKEASELASSLRRGLLERIGSATNKVLATALDGIVKGAGSEAGKRLVEYLSTAT